MTLRFTHPRWWANTSLNSTAQFSTSSSSSKTTHRWGLSAAKRIDICWIFCVSSGNPRYEIPFVMEPSVVESGVFLSSVQWSESFWTASSSEAALTFQSTSTSTGVVIRYVGLMQFCRTYELCVTAVALSGNRCCSTMQLPRHAPDSSWSQWDIFRGIPGIWRSKPFTTEMGSDLRRQK